MITVDRGGMVFDTAKIGRLKVLRQELLQPGETFKSHVTGSVRLESLRERDAPRINARIDRFATPVRWLWSGYTAFVRGGPDATASIPSGYHDPALLGLGSSYKQDNQPSSASVVPLPTFFYDAITRIYNEHYKWPEDADVSGLPNEGSHKAVPLPSPWSRLRKSPGSDDDDDYLAFKKQESVGGSKGVQVDIRELERTAARFRYAVDDQWNSFNRWKELLDERYHTRGSSEVDKVPLHIGEADLTVSPRSIPAMDGPSRGQWQSLYDFGVDHYFDSFSANEHFVITDIMVVRYASITENDCNYLAHSLESNGWKLFAADPGIMASEPVVGVTPADFGFKTTANAVLGYLPYGWQWRTRWNQIGELIDKRASFPLYTDPVAASTTSRRDATAVQNAFSSTSFDDMVLELHYDSTSHLPQDTPGTGVGQKVPNMEPARLV